MKNLTGEKQRKTVKASGKASKQCQSDRASKAKLEQENKGWTRQQMGRGRWKEQVKCKDWSALDWQMSKMQHYTLPWSECRLDDLFSFSNIEFMKKKKIYIQLNYWGFYFERRMWLWAWMCGSKGMVIRCGNHATKKSYSSYSILLVFDCHSVHSPFFYF